MREIVRGSLGPGPYRYESNGTDDPGAPLPAGIYVLRYAAPGLATSRRVALVR